MTNLTDNELRAIAYNAIGVSSEGSDIAYKISFCGDTIHGQNGSVALQPIGNSGYTIGEMQTDLGTQPAVGKSLVDSFQEWAKVNHKDWVLSEDQRAILGHDIGRNGRHIRDANYDADNKAYMAQHHGKSMPDSLLPATGSDIDPTLKERLNSYLATDAGKTFTHQTDVTQVNDLMTHVAARLEKTSLYVNATPDDQAKIFAIVGKAYNQGPAYAVGSKNIKGIFNDINDGKINNIAELNKKVDTFPDYMRTGRDAAVKGAEAFNALRNASQSNAMHQPWQAVIANPLINPTQLAADPKQPHLADQYATVKALFVQPEQGRALVDALEKRGSHNYGDPSKSNSRGFYAEGNDFMQWDRDGHGRAYVNGQWSKFSRNDISLAHSKGHALDVNITRNGETHNLLRVIHPAVHGHTASHAATRVTGDTLRQGSHNEQVQKLQTQLGELGYLDNTVAPDGKYGPVTRDAVKAYQHDHHLPEVGQAGPATQKAIQADLQPLRRDSAGPSPAVSATSTSQATAPGPDDPRNALNPHHAL